MDTLGFRRPQFSEDLAWLPAWLQHPQTEPSVECNKDLQSGSDRASRGNLEYAKDEEILRTEGAGYYSCHLFWSGEDPAHNSTAQSPSNVLHLRLHLSSDGGSHSQSQPLSKSQALPFFGNDLSPQPAELGKKTCPAKVDHNDDQIKLSNQTYISISVGNGEPLCPTNKKDDERQSEWFSTALTKDADVNHLVELSIAASEALVIHELMQTGQDSEVLPTGAILEAALQLKQVRLEAFENSFCCSSHETDETDSLSDLDDHLMADALVDVGLCFMDSVPDDEHDGDLSLSYVKDTPLPEDQFTHGNRSNHQEPISPQDNVVDDSYPSSNTLNIASCKAMPHQPDERISHISAMKQGEVHQNSSHACFPDKDEEKDQVCFVADRFRSRWFGGWTVKEENSCANIKRDNTNNKKRDFFGETSFLSESADVAPDQNSFVQNHENRPKISSQSSIHFNGRLCGKGDEGILLSQDVRSSNLSLVDPLCSVVPCSISTDNASSPLNQEHNGGQNDNKSYLQGENLCKISDLNNVSVCVDGQDVCTLDGESSETLVQRRLTSLKTYSTLPKHGAIEQASLHNNQHRPSRWVEKKLSSYEDLHCKEFSDARNANKIFPFDALFDCAVDRDVIDIQKGDVIENPVAERTSQNKAQNEPTKDGADLHACELAKGRSPLTPNRKACYNVHSFRVYASNSTGEENRDQFVAKESTLQTCQIKSIQKLQSTLEYANNTPNLSRKRVSFSEVEFELQQNKDIHKLLSSHRTCSITRVDEMSQYLRPVLDPQIYNVTTGSFMGHIKHEKLMFHGLKFLLTGFSTQKETETVRLVTKHGGVVLSDVPFTPLNSRANRMSRCNIWHLPVIICSKKLQTTKFLYGCAVNALILKRNWLIDSIAKGFLVPPEKYLILPNHIDSKYRRFGNSVFHGEYKGIFDKIGIILHGKHKFCSKLDVIIKHGGGIVFKNLEKLIQSLVANKISAGVIVAENERVLRHLKLCALESKIPMMPASWITKSLHVGELLPIEKKQDDPLTIKASKFADSLDWSQEI